VSIFKAYDIRGKYPSELNEETAYNIGRAFVKYLGCKVVCVGQDARTHSPALFACLVKGITDQGADVIDIGLCTTPLFYFATKNHDAGIMVTASHNPAEYNGFKMCKDGTAPIGETTGMKDIEKVFNGELEGKEEVQNTQDNALVSKGTLQKKDYLSEFIRFFIDRKGLLSPLQIVIDTANGMAGYTWPKVFTKENFPELEISYLFKELDMSFPNHEANPLKYETLSVLQKTVVESGADLGIALDGDGDRLFFVDEKGEILAGDVTGGLIGEYLIKKHKIKELSTASQDSQKKKLQLGYDIRCSRAVAEVWKEKGAETFVTRVGHSLIKEKMRSINADFHGEFSGHIFFKETDYTENSILSALILLNHLSESKKKLSELALPYKKYFQTGESNFKVEDKLAKMKELEQIYTEKEPDNIHWLDGLTVEFKDWWFNLRPSNTESLLRLNLEASTKELMEQKKQEVEGYIVSLQN